jgi:HK97 family phage major capsid protein
MKTLAERIKESEQKLIALRDQLSGAIQKMDEGDNEENSAIVDQLTIQITAENKSLESLERAEKALAANATPVASGPAVLTNPGARVKDSDKADLLVKAALCTFDAYVKRVPLEQVIAQRYGDNEVVKSVAMLTTKATQNPAMTNVPGYAQELVRDSYGAFMDLLRGESVLPRLPLNRYEFNGYNSIKLPGRAVSAKNMEGHFRAEGAPIRVGALATTSITLTPKSLGVIGTFTAELMERSTPSIEAIIRDAMIQDTAAYLDAAFLGSAAGTATTPPGMQSLATGTNTAASAGATNANIMADIRGRLTTMTGLNLGRRLVWIMNPARLMGAQMALTATGAYQFPEAQQGQLQGIPVITSTNVPAAVIYLIDAAEIAFAGGAPRFMGTDVATIHEEDAAPLPIVDGAKVAASPVRSLFQTNSAALRCVWEIDWAQLRPGSVQTLTAAAW